MSDEDRTKWNAKYARMETSSWEPSQLLLKFGEFIPTKGRALDVAGGAGRNAIWLSRRGLDVTIADISQVGLDLAAARAAKAKASLRGVLLDLETSPLPPGPWDLILCVCFIHRPLFSIFPDLLRVGGTLLVIHPTRTNLERHEKPPAHFLLKNGELPTMVDGLEIVRYEEGWQAEGRHDAVLVARKPSAERRKRKSDFRS